jgi:hypothetical protein
VTKVPKAIERLAQEERWREQALDRAIIRGPEPEPAPEGPTQAFTRRMAEQRREEEEHATRVRRLMFEHPNPPPDEPDPLRAQFVPGGVKRKRLRRRLFGR